MKFSEASKPRFIDFVLFQEIINQEIFFSSDDSSKKSPSNRFGELLFSRLTQFRPKPGINFNYPIHGLTPMADISRASSANGSIRFVAKSKAREKTSKVALCSPMLAKVKNG